jgi:hypothetical protein
MCRPHLIQKGGVIEQGDAMYTDGTYAMIKYQEDIERAEQRIERLRRFEERAHADQQEQTATGRAGGTVRPTPARGRVPARTVGARLRHLLRPGVVS